jgi:histidinol dehydrogenase
MPMRLSSNDSNFESQFAALLGQKRELSADIDDAIRAIITDVRMRGDAALADLTLKYDRLELQRAGLAITPAEIESAFAACSK